VTRSDAWEVLFSRLRPLRQRKILRKVQGFFKYRFVCGDKPAASYEYETQGRPPERP
jgi:hypothetical protein